MANLFPPSVDAKEKVVEVGNHLPFHTMFDVFDIDGNDILKYRFRDNSAIAYGSYFTVQGELQTANQWIEVDAEFLYEVKYHSSLLEYSESFSVQVYDGQWSNVDTAVIHTVTAEFLSPGSDRYFWRGIGIGINSN